MAVFFLDAPTNVSRSLLTVFVQIFQTEEFDNKLSTSAINTKKFVKWIGEADSASLPEAVAVLRTEMHGHVADSSASIFIAKKLSMLSEVETEQVHQILRAWTAAYLANSKCVNE